MAAMAHARRHPQVRMFFHKNHRGLDATEMPIEYLLEIEHAPFPLRVKQPDAIRSITPQGRAELGKEWAETGEPAGPSH
jgi:hypothetical protein